MNRLQSKQLSTAAGDMNTVLTLAASPHVHGGATIRFGMLWTLCALLPSAVMGVLFFGVREIVPIIASMAAAQATDWLCVFARTRKIPDFDCSALLTGMLLALSSPPDLPMWAAPLGAVFAVLAVKQAMGGIAFNFLNPALAGRAFLVFSFPALFAAQGSTLDKITLPQIPDLLLSFATGANAAWIGAVSPAAIIVGAAALWWLRIIDAMLPLSFILTSFLFFWLTGSGGEVLTPQALLVSARQVLYTGIPLGAFFMATDPVTSPRMRQGRLVYGMMCGALACLICTKSAPGNGVMAAILIMNCMVWLIDRSFRRTPLGCSRGGGVPKSAGPDLSPPIPREERVS
jgi:Na+-translocating ferredoxin:NAD+ oxidoreductase subunit D